LKLLIVEDEISLKQSIVDFLSASGYLCESASTYQEAVQKIDYHEYDCIILDIMLPGGSGLKLLRADDYLTKPFHLSELSVRISAIIRRKNFNGQSVLTVGDFQVDTIGKTVKLNQKEIDLTQKEFQLFLFLLINKNRILSKNAIAEHLWGDDMDFPANYDFIYSHIKNLRKKIMAAGSEDCIKSMYGEGYKMQIT
jgi:DNA-binding response OmpR family regulator